MTAVLISINMKLNTRNTIIARIADSELIGVMKKKVYERQ